MVERFTSSQGPRPASLKHSSHREITAWRVEKPAVAQTNALTRWKPATQGFFRRTMDDVEWIYDIYDIYDKAGDCGE